MSFDLQTTLEIAATNVTMRREHAIYLDAQHADRRIQKARNIADVLERRNRPAPRSGFQGVVINVMA